MKPNVHYIHAKPPDEFADHWYNGAGYYFADECELLHGPYDDIEQAREACKEYAKTL